MGKNVVIWIKVCYTYEVSYQQCLSTASSLFTQGAFFILLGKSSIRGAKEWSKAILWRAEVFSQPFFTFIGGYIALCRILSNEFLCQWYIFMLYLSY